MENRYRVLVLDVIRLMQVYTSTAQIHFIGTCIYVQLYPTSNI